MSLSSRAGCSQPPPAVFSSPLYADVFICVNGELEKKEAGDVIEKQAEGTIV